MDGRSDRQPGTPSRWLRYLPVAFAALVGVSVTLVLSYVVRERQHRDSWSEFHDFTHNLEIPLRRTIEGNLEVLESIGSFYDASREVDREEFDLFTRTPLNRGGSSKTPRAPSPHAGIRFLAWLPRVTPEEFDTHVSAAQSPLFKVGKGYQIRDREGRPVASGALDRYPVQFIEPFKEHEALWGMDLGLIAECRSAMRQANAARSQRATGEVRLGADPLDCLVFQPVYKTAKAADGTSVARLFGFAVAAFDLNEMIEAPLSGLNREGVALYLFDVTQAGRAHPLHASGSRGQPAPAAEATPEALDWPPRLDRDLQLAGRQLRLVCEPTPDYLARHLGWRPWWILGSGLLFTFLVATYLNTLLGRAARTERLVTERTAQLARSNAHLEREIAERKQAEDSFHKNRQLLEAILDNSPAVIYMKDTCGRYVLVNQRYETLFNVPRAKLIGQTVSAIVPPETAARIQANDQQVLEAGRPMEFEERVPLADGFHTYLSVKFPLKNADGVPNAVCGIATDITARKQAEEELRQSHERFLVQQSALIALTRSDALQAENLLTTFQHMTEVVAETLGVERVSIWRYARNRQAIQCVDLFELTANRHSCGAELEAERYPAYFRALAASEVVAADDARTDPRTREFTSAYLDPLGIRSMMDVPLYLLGELDGVLCHEHVGPPRPWLPDEKMFAVGVANLVSLAIGQWEHRRAEKALQDSEALHHSLVENLPQNILRKDLEGRFTFANQRASAGMGRPLDQIVGKTDFDFFPRDLAEKYRRDDQRVIATGKPFETIEAHVTGDGRRLYVQVIKTPVRDASGEIVGTQILFWDVTAHKENEQRLAVQYAVTRVLAESTTLSEASRRILQAVGENLDWPVGAVWHLDRQANRLRCAEFWHAPALQVPEFEAISRTTAFAPGFGLPGRVWTSGQPAWIADVTKDKNFPRAKWAAKDGLHGAFGFPIRLGSEVLGAIEFFNREIRQEPDEELLLMFAAVGSQVGQFMERRRAEEALRASEEQTRLIIETANDAFVAMDAQGRIIDWNRQAEMIFGWERAEAVGRILAQTVIPPQHRAAHEQGLKKFLATGEGPVLNRRIELSALHRDGREFPVELTISPVRLGASYVFNSFVHDITERKRAEERLRMQNKLLQEMAQLERQAHEELKKAQAQLVQAEKMSGLGQMVAGVAHEINNPLSFVSNNVAVLQRDVQVMKQLVSLYQQAEPILAEHRSELHGQIHGLCERIDLDYTLRNLEELMARSRDGLKRIQQIVTDLRDFARLDESDLHEVDLNPGIESTVNIITGLAKKKQIEIELDFAPLPRVNCFPAKINQVVMNLVSNAIQACPQKGKVTVRTVARPQEVEIHVIDDGHGIPLEIRDRIFDPFFTTKPPGQGTGLGLSISHGIVEDHGGRIEVNSIPGQGAHFIVHLPVRARPAARPQAASAAADR